MKYLYLVLNWFFGSLFLVVGLVTLIDSPLSSLVTLLMAALLLPPVRRRIGEQTGLWISPAARGISVLALLLSVGMLSESGWAINAADLAVFGGVVVFVGLLLLYDAVWSRDGLGSRSPNQERSGSNGSLPERVRSTGDGDRKGRFTELGEAVVIDTETTGLDHNEDRVIEVSALLVNFEELMDGSKNKIDVFNRRIKADRPISDGARNVHGISDDDLLNEPFFKEIAVELRQFIGDRPLVGHNVGFDKKFLHAEFKRAGIEGIWRNKVYCTQKRLGYYLMFNGVGHKRPSLDDALRIFSIDGRVGSMHGAYEDAQLTFRLAIVLRQLDALPGDVKERWPSYFT